MIYSYEHSALIVNMGEESTSFALSEQKLMESPPFYQVIMLNDDYTPMDFVVELLRIYFGKALDEATVIMLDIHHTGRGVCGVYPRDIAQTKVELVMSAAQSEEHPLQCIMEVL